MADNSDFPRYDHPVLAWEYDQRQPVPLTGELEWYAKYAALSDGQILELACGSGRLTIPLALAGYHIDGVDRSKTMLGRLKTKLKDYDAEVRKRVRLFYADIRDFTSDSEYGTVFLAYNSLQYLETRTMVHRFFHHVPLFLKARGYFLFTVRRFSHSDFTDGKRVVYDNMNNPVVDKEKRLSVGCRFTAYLAAESGQIVNERTYEIAHPTGETEHVFQISRSPVIETAEYLAMLANTGLTARVYGGYDEPVENGKSREICFVCRRD